MGSRGRVLCIDRDLIFLESLVESLQIASYEVDKATTFAAGTRVLAQKPINAVIVAVHEADLAQDVESSRFLERRVSLRVPTIILVRHPQEIRRIQQISPSLRNGASGLVDYLCKSDENLFAQIATLLDDSLNPGMFPQIRWSIPAVSSFTDLARLVVAEEDETQLAQYVAELEALFRALLSHARIAATARLGMSRIILQGQNAIWLEVTTYKHTGEAEKFVIYFAQQDRADPSITTQKVSLVSPAQLGNIMPAQAHPIWSGQTQHFVVALGAVAEV